MSSKRTAKPGWHRDPVYKPNYGRARSLLPATCLKQVVLHDNTSAARRLAEQTRLLDKQQAWTRRLCNTRRKSFIIRQLIQQQIMLVHNDHYTARLLPDDVVDGHKMAANLALRAMFYTGGKDLPNHQRFRPLLARHNTLEVIERMNEKTLNQQLASTILQVLSADPPTFAAMLEDADKADAVSDERLDCESTADESCCPQPKALSSAYPVTQLVQLPPIGKCSYYSKSALENVQHKLLHNPDNPFSHDDSQPQHKRRPPALTKQPSTGRPKLARSVKPVALHDAVTTSPVAAADKRHRQRAIRDPRFLALQRSLEDMCAHDVTTSSEGEQEQSSRDVSRAQSDDAPTRAQQSTVDGFVMLSQSNHTQRITSSQKRMLRSKYLPAIKTQLDPQRIHNALATARNINNSAVAREVTNAV